jgi:hypothetical protein
MEVKIDFDVAMEQYKKRKEENKGKQIDNSTLRAGSSMYYYCKFCGVHTETLPESHWDAPKIICDPCDILHTHGLI